MKTPSSNIRSLSPAFGFRALPGGIWALGFVSMFMDISSELVHSLLPVFMVTVLGTSMTTIGLIEGIAEATAARSIACRSSVITAVLVMEDYPSSLADMPDHGAWC